MNQCLQVPLPVYGVASIGGDTNLITNAEYRIPIAGPVMFSVFDDFGIDAAAQQGPVEAEPRGLCLADRSALRLPGLQQRLHARVASRARRWASSRTSVPSPAPTSCPACPLGSEISVIMPIINAPFRLYYAYNPLRLYETPYCNSVIIGGNKGSCSAELITRDLFPPGGAGDYTYQEVAPGLRLALSLPRAAQNLPPDGFDHVLIPTLAFWHNQLCAPSISRIWRNGWETTSPQPPDAAKFDLQFNRRPLYLTNPAPL